MEAVPRSQGVNASFQQLSHLGPCSEKGAVEIRSSKGFSVAIGV